jgi:MinD-like ATPase involved in chromosome partitioning or flagellar assembly
MDTYASIKLLHGDAPRLPRIHTIVNRATEDSTARDVHQRIHQSCSRFLSIDVRAAGEVPVDESFVRAKEHAVPACIRSPMSPAARAIDRIAAMITVRSSTWTTSSAGRSAA